jgi:hypothetical protein
MMSAHNVAWRAHKPLWSFNGRRALQQPPNAAAYFRAGLTLAIDVGH